ncbi:MAG: monovalent cation/H(+) antiporter subunit G [Acidilobaceae archaeon]
MIEVLGLLGLALVVLGAILDLIAALGLVRLPDFYTRLHAATIGAIGGAAVPLVGSALIALSLEELGSVRLAIFGGSLFTSVVVTLVAPIASHAVARAAYRSGEVKPVRLLKDSLSEKRGETT